MTTSARRLILLRHAKAEPAGHVSDALRRLERRGLRQCLAVGAELRAAGLVPETVLVSTAVRARETWEQVAAALGDGPDPEVIMSDEMYGARADEVVDLVRVTDARVRTLLVVGHEPAMSATAAYLAGSGEPAHVAQVRSGLPTAAYALLAVGTPWAELERMGAVLRDVVRPAWEA
jgi:phosphohistidine phosphatase